MVADREFFRKGVQYRQTLRREASHRRLGRNARVLGNEIRDEAAVVDRRVHSSSEIAISRHILGSAKLCENVEEFVFNIGGHPDQAKRGAGARTDDSICLRVYVRTIAVPQIHNFGHRIGHRVFAGDP